MASDPFGFLWLVESGGLAWADAAATAPPGPAGDGAARRVSFNPFRDATGLFLTFAATAPDPSRLEDFLRRHGAAEGGTRPPGPPGAPVDALEAWREEAWEMRRLIDLWLPLRDGDHEALDGLVRWTTGRGGAPQVEYHWVPLRTKRARPLAPAKREVIASPEVRPEWLELFRPPDVALPAAAYLQAKVNERLAGQVGVGLLHDVAQARPRLQPVPRTLLAALWLQFAAAVAEGKEYRTCRECGAWFELSPETARTNRRFCTNACRSRMYRQRQGRARERHAEGVPVEDIARELETDAATVRRWLDESGEG
jgi:hypothetical protein